MKTHYRVIRFLAAAAAGLGSAAAAGAQGTPCGPANDTSAALIADLRQWMTTENPNRVVLRDRVFRIPVVDVAQLSLVTDERICRKVIDAYDKLPEFAYKPARVYVVSMGATGYVSYDPDRKGGEFVQVHIFDPDYAHSGGWSF